MRFLAPTVAAAVLGNVLVRRDDHPSARDMSTNFDAVAGTGSSDAQVLSPDGEDDLARGSTEGVRVSDGVVSARYPWCSIPMDR
jgi:hypothetical protein